MKTGKIGKADSYVVEGIGEDIFPSTMHFDVLDNIVQVTDRECFIVARNLAKNEGIFTGGSGGGCVSAAMELARTLPAGSLVVSSLRYGHALSEQNLQRCLGMRERGYLDSDVPPCAADVVAVKHRAGKVREMIIVRPYSNGFSRLAHHAGAGYFAAACVRREQHRRHIIYEVSDPQYGIGQGKDLRKLRHRLKS